MTLGLLFSKIKHNNNDHIGLMWDLRGYILQVPSTVVHK